MSEPWKVRARYAPWMDGEEVVIFKGQNIVRFTLEPFDPHGFVTEPTVRSHQDDGNSFLRAVLNAAWELGLRPDGFDDTRESMAATKQHLEDMRALAFYKIGAEKPEKSTK